MRSPCVVFCAIDDLLPVSGNPLSGFAEFLERLAEQEFPCVWVSSRNRHQLDFPIRRLGHAGPFIAEGGSGVYLPEGYFNLKPKRTVRLGRFTCIPVASPQPAAADALDALAEETGVSIVPLRSLSARELMQNTGLSRQEADAVRQRDFDELFFFAGASDSDIEQFHRCAEQRKLALRSSGSFWSLALGASLPICVRELRALYDRVLHTHALTIAITTADCPELAKACDRAIWLTDRTSRQTAVSAHPRGSKALPLFSPNTWIEVLQAIQTRQF